MRTSFHHQPEAQHPNFPLSVSWQADYPILWHKAAVRKCPLLRRLWGLSGHRSASSICCRGSARRGAPRPITSPAPPDPVSPGAGELIPARGNRGCLRHWQLRQDASHLFEEPSLPALAGERHREVRHCAAGLLHRCIDVRCNRLHQRNNSQGPDKLNATSKVQHHCRATGLTFSQREVVDWQEDEIVEVATGRFEVVKEFAAADAERFRHVALQGCVATIEERAVVRRAFAHEQRCDLRGAPALP